MKKIKRSIQICSVYEHKSVACLDKKDSNLNCGSSSNDNKNGGSNANSSGRHQFSDLCYIVSVKHRITECHEKREDKNEKLLLKTSITKRKTKKRNSPLTV